jgi:hypothetical protein
MELVDDSSMAVFEVSNQKGFGQFHFKQVTGLVPVQEEK